MPIDARALARIASSARRPSTGDIITAVIKRIAPAQARAERIATTRASREALRPGDTGVVTRGRLSYQHRGGGWTRVTIRDANGSVTFSLRTPKFNELLNRKGMFYDPAQAMYSEWIQGTRAGYLYSQRRQVEGMRKAALKRGDMEEVQRLDRILEMSDERVAQFREDWVEAHTDEEIDQYYEYLNTTDNTAPVVDWS